MLVTEYTEKTRSMIEDFVKQYPSIILNAINGATTKEQDVYGKPYEIDEQEIEIELFPTRPIDYETKTEVDSQYLKECNSLFQEMSNYFDNKVEADISKDNNWASIYILYEE